ncbi:MAG: rhodanese-like domain-containing protein [Ilumatobacteraceae bacterium]
MTAEDTRRCIDDVLAEARAQLDRVDPTALRGEQDRGALIIDIRPVDQRERDGALPGAVVIDRNVLEWRLDPACPHHIADVIDYDTRIVLVCNEGYQSSLAAAQLRALGLHKATDMTGGYQAWISTTYPSSVDRTD